MPQGNGSTFPEVSNAPAARGEKKSGSAASVTSCASFEEFEGIVLDPASARRAGTAPGDVTLTPEQKVELLRRWQYNAPEEEIALKEDMRGGESGILFAS